MSDDKKNNGKVNFLLGILFLSLGAYLAYLAIPVGFQTFTHSMKRTQTIIKHTKDPNNDAQVIALGNSVMMGSFSSDDFSEAFDLNNRVYSYASTGQSFLESIFLLNIVPETTKLVILGLTATSIVKDDHFNSFEKDKFNAYIMYGYDINNSLISFVDGFEYDDISQMIRTPKYKIQLDSRGIFLASFDNFFRYLVRKDLNQDRTYYDLKHPYTGEDHVSKASMLKVLNEQLADIGEFKPSQYAYKSLNKFHHMANQKGCECVFFVLPQNPLAQEMITDSYYTKLDYAIDSLNTHSDLKIINLRDVLTMDNFFDYAHPNRTGGKLLTKIMADSVANYYNFSD